MIKIHNIEEYKPSFGDAFFFVNNVWMYLFCPTSPTLTDLSKYFYNTTLENLEDEQILFLTHIKRGGGRQNTENEWYFLDELKSGEKYTHS